MAVVTASLSEAEVSAVGDAAFADSATTDSRLAATDPLSRVRELQSRIREMQSTTLQTKALATHPMFAGLLPDGMMRAGSAYSIHGSLSLAMSMLAAPSAAGAWCGVVGVPEFGVQAALAHGIDLDRLVLVPDPGQQWLAVTAAIIDVLTVVVVRPQRRVSDSDASRLASRLRKREAALISLGDWPGSEARLTLRGSQWSGIGDGHGMITGRRADVVVETRGRPPRSKYVWLPAGGGPAAADSDGAEVWPSERNLAAPALRRVV